ncbi:MAG TPA: ABC transporter permease [Myxococcota bacterium]|nr:ABC transporter permease [Myxococcota bacterium]
MSAGEATLDQSDADVLRIVLRGSWRGGGETPSASVVDAALASGAARVTFDARELVDWDTRLVSYVRSALRACEACGVPADLSALPAGVQQLLALAAAVHEKKTGEAQRPEPLLVRVGDAALAALVSVRSFSTFLGEALVALGRLFTGRARFPLRDFLLAMQDCGARALPIVALVSLLVGLILAFMGAIQLRSFGAQIFVANLVAIGMAREMGALMVGIIMAGRTGAAFAAQLGTMTVNEEIDALRTTAISPVEYLVLPRMLALMLMMPLLCLYGVVLGIVGGMLVGIGPLGLGVRQYLDHTLSPLSFTMVAGGLFKGIVYGVIVACAGCMQGMRCGRSAEAVGGATTSAVVLSIVFIIAACGILTLVYDVLGI